LSYKIAFKKSVARDLKKIDRVQADRILRKIEDELPMKADTFPVLTENFLVWEISGWGLSGKLFYH